MVITIRKAGERDYTFIENLFAYSDELHRNHHREIYAAPQSPSRNRDYYLSLINGDGDVFLVAEYQGKPCGFIYGYIEEAGKISIHKKRRYAVVDNVVVHPEYQRKGIARKLLKAFEKWAIEEKLDQIELEVFSFNKGAKALYEDLGFRGITVGMQKTLN
ncbi:MAG: GNAT family N-acetyltransferase [Spirochaetaceae bacterium]|jgi:ribosomal protein S18 acetylase RimI-like enzyme|nr:GNAT family N-acetyltransferase [Spirochaetaceae bacterium]